MLIAQQTFSATEWVTLMTSFGVLIGLVVTGIISILGAWKLAKIEAHVNSEKTGLLEQAKSRDRELDLYREVMARDKNIASLLAQAVATRQRGDNLANTTSTELMKEILHATPSESDSQPAKVEIVNPPSHPIPVIDTIKSE